MNPISKIYYFQIHRMRKKERLRGRILLELRFVSCALFVHNTAV